jgi:hypothetical protein
MIKITSQKQCFTLNTIGCSTADSQQCAAINTQAFICSPSEKSKILRSVYKTVTQTASNFGLNYLSSMVKKVFFLKTSLTITGHS